MKLTRDQHRELMYGMCIAAPTSAAENRMRTRTAKEQHAEALAALRGPDDIPLPDADDESAARQGSWPDAGRW